MRSRAEAVDFIRRQFKDGTKREKYGRHHYGVGELRDLLDFLYGGAPERDDARLGDVGTGAHEKQHWRERRARQIEALRNSPPPVLTVPEPEPLDEDVVAALRKHGWLV